MKFKSTNIFYNDTLDSLEDDEEYSSVAERFLKSIGEDDTKVRDVYEYLRDEEWNLGSSAIRSFKDIPNFTDQQKKDYKYLRDRFENADMGGFNQYLNFAADVGVDLATDPLTLAAVIAAPFTGGGSLGARFGGQGVASLAKAGLKKVGKGIEQDRPLYELIEKENLVDAGGSLKDAIKKGKGIRSDAVKQYYKDQVKRNSLLGTAEGIAWTGMDEYLRQERDSIDGIDLRDGVNLYEIGTTAAIGGLLGAGLVGGATKVGQKFSNEVRTNLEKFSDEGYINENSIGFKASKLKDAVISKTVGRPTTRFLTLAESSDTFKSLLKTFRYDVYKFKDKEYEKDASGNFIFDKSGKKIEKENVGRVGTTYQETLNNYNGKYNQQYEDAIYPLTKRGKLGKEDQDILLKLMRSKEKDYAKKVPEATEKHLKAIRELKLVTDRVLRDGKSVGIFRRALKAGPNDWFPRRWKWSVVNKDREELAQIMVNSKAVTLDDNTALKYIQPTDQIEFKKLMDFSDLYEELLTSFPKRDLNELEAILNKYGGIAEDLKDKLKKDPNDLKVTLEETYNDILKRKRQVINNLPETEALKKDRYAVANSVIDEMLSKKEQVNTLDIEALGTIAPSSFSPRKLFLLDDFEIEKFIDDDFDSLIRDYFTQSSRLYARTKVLGSNRDEFNERYVKVITDELKEKGITLTNKDKDQLANLYDYTTGLADQTRFLQGTTDAIKISQQLAHLPLATLSSLTEIFIPLTRVGASTYVKGLAKTIKLAAKRTGDKTLRELQDVHGLSKEEAMREMHRVFLGLDQAVAQRIDSLAGEGVESVIGKKIQRAFFKTNLLDQWTRTVQLASFTMGKDFIINNLKKINALDPAKDGKKISRLSQPLLDLGIDIQAGRRWAKSGANIYSNKTRNNIKDWDNYYETQIMPAAARFTNEVILDPSKASAIRPHIQQTPLGSILFQFLGYPTAFTNTVLKNFYGDIKRNPVRGGAKVLSTGVIMTGVAAMTNYARNGFKFTNPDGSEQDEADIMFEAVQRWGGLGYGEYVVNAKENADVGGGFVGSTAKAITGPAVGDVVDSILYRKGIGELISTNVPGYSLYRMFPGYNEEDRNFKATVKRKGQDIDRALGLRPQKKQPSLEAIYGRFRRQYVEGGEIDQDVPKTSDNPSSRIDKTTGIPYEDQAGDIIQNRQSFATGRLAKFIREKGQYYLDDVFGLSEEENNLQKNIFIEESDVKDDVFLVDNSKESYGIHVQTDEPSDINTVNKYARGNLRSLNPFELNISLQANEHLSQILKDDSVINKVTDSELKEELRSLRKEYKRIADDATKVIGGTEPDPNLKLALNVYSNAIVSKNIIEAFKKAGYDSLKYKTSKKPRIDLRFDETVQTAKVPLVVTALTKEKEGVSGLFAKIKEQFPNLDDSEISKLVEKPAEEPTLDLDPTMDIDIPTRTAQLDEPILASDIEEESTRYFLLDDSQFMEQNKYRGFNQEDLKELNEKFNKEEKIEFFKDIEDNLIQINTPNNILKRQIEKGIFHAVTTASKIDDEFYGGRILTIKEADSNSLQDIKNNINLEDIEQEETFNKYIDQLNDSVTPLEIKPLYVFTETIPGEKFKYLNPKVNLLDINQAVELLKVRQVALGQELLYHPKDNNVNSVTAKIFSGLDTSEFNPRKVPEDIKRDIIKRYKISSPSYKFLTNAEIKKLYGFDTKPFEEDRSEGVDSINVAGDRGVQDERNFDKIVRFLPKKKEYERNASGKFRLDSEGKKIEIDPEIKLIVVEAASESTKPFPGGKDIKVGKGGLYQAEYNSNTGDITYLLDDEGKAIPYEFKTEMALRNLKVNKDYSKLQPDTDTVNVIVAGGRDFENYNLMENELNKLFKDNVNVTVVSGKASGADTLGEQYALSKGFKIDEYPANWSKYGKRAGMIRNKQMADNANMLVAFWDGKSKGTGNMIKEAKKKKLKVKVVRTDKQ